MATFTELRTFFVETCCDTGCGIDFAMPAQYKERKREDHSLFYCPNGHPQHYTGETEAQKFRRLYEAQERTTVFWREDSREKERRLIATKGVVTRFKHRVANGVCPCCKRTFPNLAAHMKTKHPAFKDGETT